MNIRSLEKLEDKTHEFLDHMQVKGLDKKRIRKEVIRFAKIWYEGVELSADDIAVVVGKLLERLEIEMDIGSFIASTSYKPWLKGKRKEMQDNNLKQHYWDRYQRLLEKNNFPKQVRIAINSDTESILDLTADPSIKESWSRKGLVVGHVQSGKTANYTGLVCKAADVGYKLIIILAGMSNDLRNQTQSRLDEGFVGIDTGFYGSGLCRHQLLIGVGEFDSKTRVGCLTTSDKDFNSAFAQRIDSLSDSSKPYIAVIKKNKISFDNLINWLKATESNFNDIPLLLIDDEADHASINTNKEHLDPTTINKKITELLAVFPKNAYVGYTATPFANVFINPSETDIFPEDFIFTLDTPTNYFGPEQVFGSNKKSGIVKVIPLYEYEDIFSSYIPLKHRTDLDFDNLPPSLEEAIIVFILSCAERNLRGQAEDHKTMMINVSVYKDVQHSVWLLAYQFVMDVKQAISVNFSMGDDALDSSIIQRFYNIWKKEFSARSWDDLLAELNNAIDPLSIIEVNTSQHGESLSYKESDWPNGRTVIAIGGYSLSRGLTLEGLTTSYLLRNTKMYDTLMQMGRWFGYRKDYEDLCRIYMPEESIIWYEFITTATEELRGEFAKMKRAGKTPSDFGLKVKRHPTALLITAQNKMRTGKTVIDRAVDLKGSLIQTYALSTIQKNIDKNVDTADKLISSIIDKHELLRVKSGYLFDNICHSMVSNFINGFVNHPFSHLTESDSIRDYINLIARDGVDRWKVLVINESGSHSQLKRDIGGLNVNAVKRTIPLVGGKYITAQKDSFTSVNWEHAALSKEMVDRVKHEYKEKGVNPPAKAFIEKMEVPFLKIYLIDCITKKGEKMTDNGFIAWSISFPGKMKSKKDRFSQYVLNVAAQQQEMFFVMDGEEDDYE